MGLARALLPAVLSLALAAGQAHAQSDTAPPTVWFVEADLSGHSIDVYLSEDVKNSAPGDIDESLISVRDGQSASAGSAGAFSISLPVQAIGETSLIALDMTEAQRQAMIGMAAPYMHLSEGAFTDPAGNPIAATAVEIDAVRDATAPVLRRPPVLDTDSGRVLLPFSEFIDASRLAPGGLHVRDGAGAAAGAGQITMSSATLLTSSDTETAVFVLGAEQLGSATSMSSPHLYVDANSVYDVSGNAFQPSAAGSAFRLTDAVRPSLESASLDDGTGALLIMFDETVDVSSLSLTRAHIRQDGIGRTAVDASNSVTLEGAQVTTASDTDTVSVLLTEQQRLVAVAIASPLLNLDAGAVRDSFGNAIERSSAQVSAVPDTRGPSILVAEIDLRLFAIDVLFDENVKNSAPGDIDESLISVRDGRSAAAGSAGAFTITLPVGTSGSGSLVALDIDEAQRQAMIGMASPHMHVSAGAFSDIAGNPIAATVAEIDAAPDTAAPELRRPPVLDIDSGRVILPFSEFIDASRLAPGGLHVRDGAGASAGAGQITMSSATLLTSSDTQTVAFGLGPQQSRAAAGMSSPHLYVDANSVYDVSGNAFEAPASGRAFSVTDTGPQVLSSRAVKLDEIEVSFSEPVRTSGAGAPTGWTVSGADANSAAVSSIRGIDGEALDSTAVLVLSVGLADTAPDVTVSYSGGNVEDAGSNALADYSAAPSDGIAPTFSGRTEAPNRAVFETSEQVTQIPFPISAPSLNDQLSCANGSITPLANQDTITFTSRDCTVDPSWSGSVEYRPDGLRDLAGNSLSSEDLFLPLDDGIAPSITGARATSATTVEVSFDEGVKTSDLAGKGWSVSGADSASRTVDSSTALDGNTVTLTLSGPLSGTAPDIALRYETAGADVGADAGSGSGDITDKASSSNTSFPGFLGQPVQRSSVSQYLTHPVAQDNALAARQSIPVSDGIAPQIASATATKPDEITVAFSEPVRMSGAGAPTGWTISGADSASVSVSSITDISGTQSGTAARLLLSGQLAGTAPDLAVSYSGGNVEDLAGNALAAYSAAAGDGIAPTFAARATALDGITVTFSENLTVSDASARGWSISGADSASRLVVSSTTASDADSIVLTLDGDLADTAPDGVVLRYKTSAGDVPGDPDSGSGAVADPSGNAVQAASVAVSDGIAPAVTAEATAPDKITVTFSEDLTTTDETARGWSISGADAVGLTVDASTATSAGSSIVLTLSGNLADTNPDNAVLRYETSGTDVPGDPGSGSGAIGDLASNALAARPSIPVSDGLAPSFEAGITGDRTVIIDFGEQVSGSGNLAEHWAFSHADGSFSVPRSLSVTSLSSLTGSMAIGLDRDMPRDISGLSVGYSGSAVSDAAGNALPASSADVSEERRPAVASIRATELDKIAVKFTSPVKSSDSPADLLAAWSVSGGDAASPSSLSVQSMTSLQVLTSSLTLTLSSALPDTKPDGVILAYDGSAATIASEGGKQLEDLSGEVSDGIKPTVTARATALNRIAVTFSEPLTIQDTTAKGWSVSGTDAAGRSVASSTAASSANSIVLTLDGRLADTRPNNVVLRYETSGADVGSDSGSGSGAIDDSSSNAMEARQNIPISDGIAPTISATTVLPNKVAYRFSEAVSISGSFTIQTFRLSPGCATGSTSALAGQNSVTFTSGCNISSSSSGSFLYDGRNVSDLAGNRPGAWVYMPIDDGVAPSIAGVTATSLTTVQVTFDEDVSTSDTAGKGWSISGTDSASRTVDSSTSLDGRTVTLTLSGPLPDTTPDIRLRYETSGADIGADTGSGSGDIADKSSSRAAFPEAQDRPKQRSSVAQYLTFPDAAVSSPLASRASIPVSDGIAPRIVSAEATKPDEITVGFSEAVRMSDTGAPTGWTISGTDSASVSVSSITDISSTQSGTAARLLLSGNLADTSPDITVAYSGGNIEDIYDNALAAYSEAPSDGIAPTIASAQSGTLDTITVTFSEAVDATSTSPGGTWTLGGSGLPAGVSVSANPAITTDTTTLTLSGDLNDPIGVVTLRYDDGAGDAEDKSDNALAAQTVTVTQDLAPSIKSARVTGPGTAQIEYSEPVTAAQSDYASLVVGGQSRNISDLSGGTTATHTITFTGGDPLGTDATGSVSISAANITDSTNNALGTGALSQPLSDGQSPTVSARYTARDTVYLEFSEPVRLSSGTAPTEWAVSGTDAGAATGASSVSVITTSVTSTSATLTLNGDLADKTVLDFTLSYSGGNIEDGGGNPLAAYSATPDDGIAPAVSSAKYTSRDTVDLTFSEPVMLSSGSAPTGWTVSGADSGAAAAGSAITVLTTSRTATSATLTLDGDLADKTVLDFTLTYASGNIEDGGGNELSAYSAKPDDGIAPKITSAKVTGPSQVTVTYSENAVTSRQHYQSPITVAGSARSITGSETGRDNIDVLTFGGTVGTDAVGSINVDSTQVVDLAGNALGTDTALSVDLTDGQSPTISAEATALDQITVTFSENLSISDETAQGWSVSGGDATGRTVDSSTAVSSSTTIVLTLSSDMDDTKPDGVLLQYKTSAGNVGSDADSGSGAIQDPSSNAVAARSSIPVSDGIAPEVSSSKYTARNTVDLEFSEPVLLSSAGAPAGWAAAGADVVSSPTAGSAISVLTTSRTATSATLTLDSDLADKTLLDFTLTYASGNIEDQGGNALAPYSAKPDDGFAPRIGSAEITGPGTVVITYSENATAAAADYAPTVDGSARTVSNLAGSGTATHTVTFAGGAAVGTGAAGTVSINSTQVKDASDNALGTETALSRTLADGQAPTVVSTEVTGPRTVSATFSESVRLSGVGTKPFGWAIAGADSNGARVDAVGGITEGASATAATLTLDGDIADRTNPAITVAYSGGNIEDAAGNGLVSYAATAADDGIAPQVSAAKYVGRDSVLVTFSEPVRLSSAGAPTGWTASGADVPVTTAGSAISVLTASATATSATLTLDNYLADKTLLDFTLSYDGAAGNIEDESDNALAAYSDKPADGIKPVIASAVSATLDTITVTFSENVNATGTSGAGGWTLSGADSGSLTVLSRSDVSQTASNALTLTLDGNLSDPIGTVTLNYSDGAGDVQDESDNTLASGTAAVTQDLAPTIASARVTGPAEITVRYSEAVTAAQSDYASLVVGGQSRNISGLSDGTTDTHTISFTGGDPLGTDATGSVSISAANITDSTNNALGTGALSQPLSDGQSPTVSARYTARDTVALTFSEPVRLSSGSAPAGWTVSGTDSGAAAAASSVSVITTSVTSTSATLTLNGDLADKTLLDFTLSYSGGNIEDDDGNALAAYSAAPDDGIAPAVSSSKYTSRNMVDLEFSEPVRLSSGSAPTEWIVSGTDKGGAAAASSVSVITTSATSTSTTLTLDGDLADKTVLDFTLAYAATGNIEDQSGNALAAYSAKPDDGIAPEISSAKYTARNSVELTFSEPVRLSSAGAPTGWTASGADVPVTTAGSAISVLTASATATSATLTLDNDLADKTLLDFTLSYDGAAGNIEDESDNALAQYSDSPSDGIAPRITSAEATGLDQITVTFSEDLSVSGTSAQGWSVSGGDADGRTVDSSTAVSSGTTMVLTLGSDMDDTKPDGVLLQYKTSSGDVAGDANSGSGAISDPSSNALAARQSIPVSDGIAPTFTAEATALNEITVTFSEPVSVTGNAQGWSVSGADADGLDVTASTATSSGLSTVLTLSGNLGDTNPDNAVLRYKTSPGDVGGDAGSGSGAVADPSSNAVEARANAPVSDGLAPAASFALTDDRVITVAFSEDVSSSDNDASHWTVSGADAAGRAVSSVSSLTSATGSMTVALDGDVPVPSTDLKLAYSAGGTISDGASLVLAAVPATAVQDDRRPSIMSAAAVDRDTIVVEFTRGVSSSASEPDLLSAWSVSGGDAASPAVLSVQGASSLAVRTSSLTLTLSGSLPDTKPDGVTLSFDSAAASVSDTESRNMADASVAVADGIAPEITSARVTGPSQITIEYGEDVLTSRSHYGQTVSVGGSDRSISGAQGGQTDTVTITFSGAVGTGATGSVSIDAARVADVAGNALGAGTLVQALADGQKPTVASAKATKIDEITVTFSEKVKASGTAGPAGWTISGGDSDSRLVDSRSDISPDAGSTTLVLRLNGGLADTKPEGVKLAYAAASGTVADVSPAANELDSASDIDVTDGVKPEIESAKVTGPRQITIVYSETVTHSLAHYNNINVGGARFPSGFAGANTDTAVLSFAGSDTGTDAAGTVQINYGAIRDGSGNALGSGTVTQTLTDGQAPTFTAKATGLDEITVTFSENLSISDETAQGWSVSGTDADGRTVDSSTAVSNGNTVVLTLSSDMEDTKPDGVVLRYKTSSGDVTGDANSGSGAIADPASNALEAKQSTAVSDGIKPKIESAKVTGPGQLTITYGEAVTASQSHYGSATVGGQTATISSISGQTTATHVVSFTAPNPVGTGATGSVQINAAQVKDGSNNALGTSTALSRNLEDGQNPSVASATVADRRTIQVAFSESVRLSGAGTAPFGWAISGTDANSAEVASMQDISESVSGTSATLNLDRDIADTTSPSVTVAYSGGNIEDTSDNELAAYAAAAADDGIAPRIESAAATSLTTIEVAFSEPVSVTGNAQGWSVSGADADGLHVTASTATSSGLSTVLTLSGNLGDTNPDNAVLRYKTSAGNVGSDAGSGSGDIADLASNALEARASTSVFDGIAPTASFALTDDSAITVSFSEAVSSSSNAASNWAVSGADAAGRAISSVSAIAGSAMTIQLGGAALPVPFTDLKLAYDGGGAITDGASLALASIPAAEVADERRPSITSAEATGPRTIVVTFSRDVSSSASAQDLLSAWSVSGGDADSPARLRVSGLSPLGSETRSMTVTLDGDLPDTKPDGVVLAFDATPGPGTSVSISDSSSRSLADASVSVGDGIAPEVESAQATGPRTIVATFSEGVRLSGAGTAPFGWAISGTDANSAEVASIQDISESVSGTSATLNLDRDIAGTTSPSVTVAYSGGNIEDTSGNDLAAYAAAAADGIAPTVTSVTATSRNTIAVAFSEPVRLDPTGAPTGWTLSGTDAAGRAVSTIAFGSPASTATLTLDGDIADKTNPSVTVAYSGGNLEDTLGNDLAAYAAAAAADGIAPTFTARATALDKIAVTFSEAVTATGTSGAGWSISGGDSNSRTVLSSSDISSGSTSLVLTLNGNLTDTKPDGVVLRYDPAAGDAQDAAGNEASGTAAVSDGIAPAIASAESREADKITVTFSEPVSGTATAPGTTWELSGAGAGGRTVTVYGAFSGTSVELTVSSAFADPIGAVTLTYASPPGDIKDDADLALAGASEEVTQNLAPFISSAEATSLNAITVTFSEAVRGTATDPSDTWKLGGADAAGITVSQYPAPSGTSLVLGLSGELPDTDPDLSLQYVRAAGDVEDLTGTPLESTQSPHVAISDGLAPALSSAELDEGTGVLTLAFTEAIDVSEMNEAAIYVREAGASSGGVALSASARTTAADSATVSFTLAESDRQAVIAMETPQLDVSAGAVRDPDGNTIAASADNAIGQTPDAVAPQLQSASLDEGAGTISLTFDEKMSSPTAAQAARVEIGTSGANISFAEADIASAELDSAGTTVTITLSEAKRQEIIAATPSDIDVFSGGLRDVSGAEASSSGTAFGTITTDAVRPTLASAVLNTDDGIFVFGFSETMDASSFAGELAKVSVSAPGTPVQLAGTARADGTNTIVTLEPAVLESLLAVISAAPNAGAPGLLSLTVPGAAPLFTDTSGNAVVSVSGNVLIEDGRPPALVSASVTSSDTIVARFSEDLADNTVQLSDFEVPGYDISSVSEMSGRVTITMANPETFTVRDTPGVRMAGPVSDLFGNELSPGPQVISVNRIMPAMISQFTVSHDGPAAVGDQIRITLRTQDAISPELAVLRVNGQAVPVTAMPNGFDAAYTVPAGAPQGPLALYVEIVSATGTPAEFSERHLTGPNATIDTVPPSITSSWISGVDSITLVYSEPVTASASDYTGIVDDGAAPVPASRAVGSGGTVVTVSWPGDGTTPSSVRLTAGAVGDSAGNEAAPAQITADSAQTQVTLGAPGIPLARGTTVETITAPSGIEPVVDVSSFTGTATDAAVVAAGGGSAVFESELRIVTRTFGLPDATFPAGTQAGGLGPLASGGAAFGEAITIASSSSTAHLSEDQRELYPLLFDGTTTTVQVGHPGRDIVFDRPVLLEFDIPLSNALVFSVGTLGVPLPIPACDPSWDTSALPVGQSVPEGWPPGTYDTNACVDEGSDSVWTGHFSLFGVSQPPPRGGSECDDCTPPTLGYDEYGARLVDAGFAYNGLASDVEYFFTPYPLIESEVGKENTVVLRIYENEGPQNVSHAALAFGLRSGEVISESRAVINYDISFDGTGEVSAIDPDGAIDLDSLSAEHETVQCSPGSELQCLQITIKHTFRAPLEFDIVGTDVWDSQRNSWQNYYNHGIKISGEPLDGRPGIEVGGVVLYPISPGSANRDVMIDSSGQLFKLSPEGAYMPLANQSRLYHDIDESMYIAEGAPMQGYGRSDPQFGELVYEQILRAQKVLSGMNAGEPGAPEPARAHELADPAAAEARLREALLAEQQRAQILSDVLFGRRG